MRRILLFLKNHRNGSVLALLLLICCFMLFFRSGRQLVLPQQVGFSFFSFFQNAFHAIGNWTGETVNSIQKLKEMQDENQDLRKKLIKYRGMEREMIALRQENAGLRKVLKISEELQLLHISAQVIARDPENIFNTIVINKGLVDGVKKGDPVISVENGIRGLVGKVHSVGLTNSSILPITDENCFVAVRLFESRFQGLAHGQGKSGKIEVNYIKKRARDSLVKGDLVVTSGLASSDFPAGVFVGRVDHVQVKDYETSINLILDPVVSISKLEYVYIIKKEDNAP